jgi:hypothetical protein
MHFGYANPDYVTSKMHNVQNPDYLQPRNLILRAFLTPSSPSFVMYPFAHARIHHCRAPYGWYTAHADHLRRRVVAGWTANTPMPGESTARRHRGPAKPPYPPPPPPPARNQRSSSGHAPQRPHFQHRSRRGGGS